MAYSSTASIRFLPLAFGLLLILNCGNIQPSAHPKDIRYDGSIYREHISINEGWKFFRYTGEPDNLIYDERPRVANRNDNIVADMKPTDSVLAASSEKSLKKWILPSANDFINDPAKQHQRPAGNPGND